MKEHKALKSILKYYKISDGKLMIGGKTAEEIASQIGTPYYVYDLSVAKKKFEMLRSLLPSEVDIHYAIKANPHRKIVKFFLNLGTGFDVASAGELNIVLEAGADPKKIGFAGPGKRQEEIRLACRAGIGSLNVESIDELNFADRIAAEEKKQINICLRVNPSYELTGAGMKMGGGAKQFGMDQEIISEVLSTFKNWPNLSFRGFHIFAGSQNLKFDALTAAFENALDTVIEFLPYCPQHPEMVNLGGGFGIPYFLNETELDIISLGSAIEHMMNVRKKYLENTKLFVESGRYLVGESGIYVSRVLYKKKSRGETFLIVDGGMHQHLAASGNFGQVIKKNYPIVLPNLLFENSVEEVNIVGPLCTPLDQLGSKVPLPNARPGDLIAIFLSGAYGYTASPRTFLGHPEPKEIVLI
jgi:diaminopimelate decarboxylase